MCQTCNDRTEGGVDFKTSWGTEYGKVNLNKMRVRLGFPCCNVLGWGAITTRCWSCEKHTGWYYDRISHTHPLMNTNPFAGADMGPGKLSHQINP